MTGRRTLCVASASPDLRSPSQPLTGIKLYCLVTEAHVCCPGPLRNGAGTGLEPATYESQVRRPTNSTYTKTVALWVFGEWRYDDEVYLDAEWNDGSQRSDAEVTTWYWQLVVVTTLAIKARRRDQFEFWRHSATAELQTDKVHSHKCWWSVVLDDFKLRPWSSYEVWRTWPVWVPMYRSAVVRSSCCRPSRQIFHCHRCQRPPLRGVPQTFQRQNFHEPTRNITTSNGSNLTVQV